MSPERHILVLVDRDWTHPQASGTGTVLRSQVVRWLDAGHRVSVVAAAMAARAASRGTTQHRAPLR